MAYYKMLITNCLNAAARVSHSRRHPGNHFFPSRAVVSGRALEFVVQCGGDLLQHHASLPDQQVRFARATEFADAACLAEDGFQGGSCIAARLCGRRLQHLRTVPFP